MNMQTVQTTQANKRLRAAPFAIVMANTSIEFEHAEMTLNASSTVPSNPANDSSETEESNQVDQNKKEEIIDVNSAIKNKASDADPGTFPK
jgi:hypothetical protein